MFISVSLTGFWTLILDPFHHIREELEDSRHTARQPLASLQVCYMTLLLSLSIISAQAVFTLAFSNRHLQSYIMLKLPQVLILEKD